MLVGDIRHLRGWEEALHNQVGCGGEGGGEEKWRPDGTGPPEEQLGAGRCSHACKGPLRVRRSAETGRDLQGIRGLEGNVASISPAQ